MKTLVVKSRLSLSDIDGYYYDIADDLKIRLPKSIKYAGGLGVEAALVQFISTWARVQTHPILHTYVSSDELDGFSSLCDSLYGVSALALVKEILLDNGEDVVLKKVALLPLVKKYDALRALNFSEAVRGFRLNIFCIRGGSQNGLMPPLYNNNEVVGQDYFNEITNKALRVVIPSAAKAKILDDESKQSIALALRQLFLNADQHARTDFSGNEYVRDFRSISFRCSSYTKEEALGVSDSKELRMYFQTLFARAPIGGRITFLELSVIDCGPGFASKWLRKAPDNIDDDEEISAVLKCFELHATSKSIKSAGFGLDMVLQSLERLGGIFRLRTGGVVVERGYYFNESSSSSYRIGSRHVRLAANKVCGSVFTVVIPLQEF